ncbi:CCA-adding enzyme [Candidatus Nitrosocosmicus franklandus]|uniref:CCA-adding enzyme n=2 Tax=Candidatus Nitrosocosmicus franklandianus TaxID=1798806 RepID=A0A484IFJ2_9ARCH|nr:CCA-adding enzyme [Candidatus Nitrosocosmicus franklandus]
MKSMNIHSLIERILIDSVPSTDEEERLIDCANSVRKKLDSYILEHNLEQYITDIVFGGSFAKGTWLKNETDIDIFLKFRYELDYDHFETLGKQIGMQSLTEYSPYLRYADHPYVEAVIEGIKVNIVPCFDVPFGKWKSAADRSPFHTSYMINHLNQQQKNQVRVLKRFLKALKIYGAEISVEGFSGYVCEVLISKFGSFLSTLEFFSKKFSNKMIISINENTVSLERTNVNHNSFAIILDPIDQNRNLGSAISARSVAIMIQASRRFLSNPSEKYFTSQNIFAVQNNLKNLLSSFILVIEFTYTNRPSDVIWGQLKKLTKSIIGFSESYGFKIFRSICSVNDKENHCVIALLLESTTISSLSLKVGPEILRINDVEKFAEANEKSPLKWIDNNSITKCILFRDHTNIKEYLKYVFENSPNLIGIPKGLKTDFLGSQNIYLLNQHPKLDLHVSNTISELITTDDRLF